MPPPPPNFIPAAARRNRRPLDPTRHLQSRELWNKVRFHASSSADATTATHNSDGNNDNNCKKSTSSWPYYKALLQAILYEIQPFRIKPCYNRVMIFLKEEDGLRHVLSTTVKNKTLYILDTVQKSCRICFNLLRQYCTIQSIQQHKLTIGKASLILIALKLYHRTLLYLHELLHAGPILIILTLFFLLYTIGLGENTGASSGIPSAYSVFNRGMTRILGTVDAEDLARQYAGGAAAAMGGGGGGGNNNAHHRVDNGGGIWMHDNDSNGEDDDEDEHRLRNEWRRQRRLERLQRRNNQEDGAIDNNNNVNELVNGDVEAEDDDDDENIQNNTPIQANGNGNNAADTNQVGARKSGKKARRRNLELRREMQRQRQAAAANGFGRGDGDDVVAMDRLIGDVAD